MNKKRNILILFVLIIIAGIIIMFSFNRSNKYVVENELFNELTITEGDKVEFNKVPTKVGYNFIGWYTKEVDGEEITKDTIVKLI